MGPCIDLDGVAVSTAHVTPRFCRLLRLAWQRLPDDDRRAITRHWSDPAHQTIAPAPLFLLTRRAVDGAAAGATSMSGFLLRFDGRVIAEWDEERVEDLIARQLAHVHNYATEGTDMSRFRWSEDSLRVGEQVREVMDDYARDRALAWGFEPVYDVV